MQCAPPRRAPVQIVPTQMEDDDDFKRAPWACNLCTPPVNGCKKSLGLSMCSTRQRQHLGLIEEYVGAEMAKARIYEDLPARDSESIGGFKHAHVRTIFTFPASHLLISIILYSISTPCQNGKMVSSACNIIVGIGSNAAAALFRCSRPRR